ncbi:MAG: xanthine dehydrogenase family protein molybdopterin-binding subunit, partial [Trebonia sp.]
MGLYGIGQPVRREEDPKLLKGQGHYTDDVVLGREARAYVVRSPHAHAKIVAIDVRAAKQSPGVVAVLTRDDLKARKLGTLLPVMPRTKRDGSPAFVGPQPILAMDRVRYVGDPVAFVVAETLNEAKDAAELVEIEYKALPAVVTAETASAPGAPAIWDQNPGNEAFFHEVGDKAAVEAAFAKAAHIVRHKVVVNRVTANSMETRGCIGEYVPLEDRYVFRSGTQSVHGTRAMLAQIFRLPQNKFRVICENMGGGFGMKGGVYPEDALCLWASEIVGRPVKWIAERSEGIQTDEQGRDSVTETELALDKDGK